MKRDLKIIPFNDGSKGSSLEISCADKSPSELPGYFVYQEIPPYVCLPRKTSLDSSSLEMEQENLWNFFPRNLDDLTSMQRYGVPFMQRYGKIKKPERVLDSRLWAGDYLRWEPNFVEIFVRYADDCEFMLVNPEDDCTFLETFVSYAFCENDPCLLNLLIIVLEEMKRRPPAILDFNLNRRNKKGETALVTIRTFLDSHQAVEMLLSFGADPKVVNDKGENIAHLAMKSPHFDKRALLAMFKAYPESLSLPDYSGMTPREYVKTLNCYWAIHKRAVIEETLRMLEQESQS